MALVARKIDLPSVSGKLVLVYALIVLLLLVALCSYSVSGIRGTDQYWYIADTESLIRDDPPVTNFRFPGMLLREGSANPTTYFVHNGPVLHINKYLAKLLGQPATSAWEFSNLIWWVGATLLLFGVLCNVAPVSVAILGALLYLTTPIVVWQAANYLQEMWLGFLSAVFFYFSYNLKKKRQSNLLAAPFIILGALSHPFFVLSSVYLVGAAFIYRKGYAFILTLGAALVVAVVFKGSLFPSSFPPDLSSIITSTVPGKTNLLWQFDDNPLPVSASLIGAKISDALRSQFFSVSNIPMNAVANLGLVSLLVLLILRKFRLNRVLCYTLFSVGAWWAMVVLLQNQSRYLLLILPALIACIVLALAELAKPKLLVKLLMLLTICFFAADVYLLSKVRSDTREESERQEAVSAALSLLPPDARFAVVDENRGLMKLIISQLSPSIGLMVDPRYIQQDRLAEVWALFKPEFLITSMAELPEELSIHLVPLVADSAAVGGSLLTVHKVNSP